MERKEVTAFELYNLLQAQKNWPNGGPPVLLDARSPAAFSKRMVRGAHRASVSAEGTLSVDGPARCWWDQTVCVYGDAEAGAPTERAVLDALSRDGQARGLLLLSESFEAFRRAYPFLTARADSSKAAKRPSYPSCIVPDLLYLGDLADASALGSLRDLLNVQHAVTALAELTPSLKDSVAESKMAHTWCNVRDVEGADIKEHFDTAYQIIEQARAAGTAVFVHCSRGISRSASLCIAYLMRKERWSAQAARDYVEARRPVILPNDGFWRCLQEQEKEWSGERSGVYAPAVTKTRLEDLEFDLYQPYIKRKVGYNQFFIGRRGTGSNFHSAANWNMFSNIRSRSAGSTVDGAVPCTRPPGMSTPAPGTEYATSHTCAPLRAATTVAPGGGTCVRYHNACYSNRTK